MNSWGSSWFAFYVLTALFLGACGVDHLSVGAVDPFGTGGESGGQTSGASFAGSGSTGAGGNGSSGANVGGRGGDAVDVGGRGGSGAGVGEDAGGRANGGAGSGGVSAGGSGGGGGAGGSRVKPSCAGAITYSSTLSITTQAELHDFPPIAAVAGNLQLSGPITDLSPLSCLERVDGRLTITQTLALGDLKGLEQLRQVSGPIIISYNAALATLAGLDGLESIDELYVQGNPSLHSLEGLSPVEDVRTVRVEANAQLASLHGLEALKSIGSLALSANQVLSDLTALSGVQLVLQELSIGANALHSLAGLENAELGGNLSLAEAQLETLEALSSVEFLGTLSISGSTQLEDLEGLRNLQGVSRQVRLVGNPRITSLHGLRNLTTAGGLELVNMNIADLSDLQQLQIASGSELRFVECPALENLQGLSLPTSLQGLTVNDCPKLKHLGGFENVGELSVLLEIDRNAQLTNLAGLEHVLNVRNFYIEGNPVLGSLAALERLTVVSDAFFVNNNPQLPQCQVAALRATAAPWLVSSNISMTGNDTTATCP